MFLIGGLALRIDNDAARIQRSLARELPGRRLMVFFLQKDTGTIVNASGTHSTVLHFATVRLRRGCRLGRGYIGDIH